MLIESYTRYIADSIQNLDDFKSTSCGTYFSYFVVWWFFFISLAVYAIDLWTASNLLFFDRWSGQVKPVIPFNISRWIFAGCIILSWVLLIYRWIKAVRAIKGGAIVASYLDPLAVRVQSIRMGKEGRGWKRFLVFAALTKGRKGAEYVALFTYFTFEGKAVRQSVVSSSLIVLSLATYSLRRRPSTSHKRIDSVFCATS